MNDEELLHTQRALRRRLFEGSTAVRWKPGRELAAQLLLYLDDPDACWRITTEWLRELLDADRVDGGFGGYIDADCTVVDYIVAAEAQRSSLRLPTVMGHRFDAADPSIRTVWSGGAEAPGVAAIVNVSQERRMTPRMRMSLASFGTAAKLALPVRNGMAPVGLICADWHREAPRWDSNACNELGGFVHGALGPVLGTAAAARSAASALNTESLTPAERRVAQLVATGLSYKEVARQLGRSVSTVDHQLRSIREKLQVRSTARLAYMLNEQGKDEARLKN